MVLENLHEQDGKTFCNVVTDDLGFETEEEKKAAEERDIENKELLDFVKESVGEERQQGAPEPQALHPGLLPDQRGPPDPGDGALLPPRPQRGDAQGPRHPRAGAEPGAPRLPGAEGRLENDREKAKKLSQILSVLAEMTAGMDVEDPNAFAEQVAELF